MQHLHVPDLRFLASIRLIDILPRYSCFQGRLSLLTTFPLALLFLVCFRSFLVQYLVHHDGIGAIE